jgi:polysaccharide biosynthesis protein PslG
MGVVDVVRRFVWLAGSVCLAFVLLLAGSGPWTPPGVSAAAPYTVYLPLVVKNGVGSVPPTGVFGYGMQLSMPANSGLTRDAGFGYVKLQLPWKVSEPQPGQYDWADSDPGNSYAENFVRDAEAAGMKVVLRVDMPPGWANGNGGDQTPPSNPADYGSFMQALATKLKGRVVGYEIWNEPNIASEWGGRSPSPTEYTALLRAAYNGVKAGDPSARVIAAGMASTGGDGGANAMNDVDFIRGMYAAGAKGYFDVLGSHPYGFYSPPELLEGAQVNYFRRAEAQRQVMVDNGDADKQVWATEFGWLIDPAAYGQSCSWPDRDWQKVSPQDQADYLVRAYQYAFNNWPWMGPMFTFNLDFSAVSYYGACEPMRWYSIVNGDYSARPAYTALKNMAKPTR